MNDLAEDEDEVVYPEPGSDPIPHLRTWQDGFKCEAKENDTTVCGYIRRTVQDMQLHCCNKHNWTNPQKRGRTSKGSRRETNRMWVEGVYCQKFTHAGRLGRLFEVRRQDKEDTRGESVIIQRQLEAVFQETTAVLDEVDKNANARIDPDHNRHVTHATGRRTGLSICPLSYLSQSQATQGPVFLETTPQPGRFVIAQNANAVSMIFE